MKNIIFFVQLFLLIHINANSQSFDWALKNGNGRSMSFGEISADQSGNGLFTGTLMSCIGCDQYFIHKYDPSGNLLWTHILNDQPQGGTISGTSVTADVNNYIYSSVYLSTLLGVNPAFVVGDDTIQVNQTTFKSNFIVKYEPGGQILWAREISNNGFDHLSATVNGNVYVTGTVAGTRMLDSTATELWSIPSLTGTRVTSDNLGNAYVLSTNTITKLSPSGNVLWSLPFGGLDISLSSSGQLYVAATDSVYSINTAGAFLWSKPNINSEKVAAYSNGAYILDSDSIDLILTHINPSGNVIFSRILTGLETIFVGGITLGDIHGYENINNESGFYIGSQSDRTVVLCPKIIPAQDSGVLGIKKILGRFVNDNIPTIGFTPSFLRFPTSSGTLWDEEWSACLGDTSQVYFEPCFTDFSPGNNFIAELSDANGNFSNPVVIGSLSSASAGAIPAVAPSSVVYGTGYRVRVKSTNPVSVSTDNGYDLTVFNLSSTISLSGNASTSFCNGAKFLSCTLSNAVNPPVSYQWYRNGNLISGQTNNTYYPNATGVYNVEVKSTYFEYPGMCATPSSNSKSVTVYQKPTVTIINNGNPYLCIDDSAQLVANSPTAVIYQWKRYNATVSGVINSSTYYAKKAGEYRVKVTDINGCTRLSTKITLTGPPKANLTASGPLTFCAGDSVTLYATIQPGLTYQWKRYGNNIVGATSPFYTAKTTGSYKCIITDQNGCVTPSQTKDVTVSSCPARITTDHINMNETIHVFPNPASNLLHIDFRAKAANLEGSYCIVDVIGKTLDCRKTHFHSDEAIDISFLPPGSYILKVNTGSEVIYRRFEVSR